MKTKILGLLAVGLLAGPVTASAVNITYSVNRTVGNATIVGSIVTDGTLGAIGASNIVGFALTANLNVSPCCSDLTNPPKLGTIDSSVVGFFGEALNSMFRATATELFVDDSTATGDGSFSFFSGVEDPYGGGHPTSLYYTVNLSLSEGVFREAIELNHEDGGSNFTDCGGCTSFFRLPSRLVIGTAPGTSPVPEPGSLALLGLGLAGLGFSRRRKAN